MNADWLSDSEPSEEIRQIRKTVRQFLDEHVSDAQVDRWEAGSGIPRSVIAGLAELGLCELTIPEQYGGSGRHVVATLAVVTELGRRCHSLAGLYWAHVAYSGLNLGAIGTEAQRQRFLPDAARGRLLLSYGLSEPNVGADLASVEMTAVRDGDRVVVDGTKRWSSGADVADYMYALVRTGPREDRYRNLSFVLVPLDASGVTVTPRKTMGDQGMSHCDVVCDAVVTTIDNVVGGVEAWNQGWSMLAGPALEVEKLGIPAMALGIGEAAVSLAWTYSEQRRQFGGPISAHQSIRHKLADAQTALLSCHLMLRHAAERVEQSLPSAVETSMAKLYISETVRTIVISCQEILGAYGYAEDLPMARYVRDAFALPIVGGSSAIQRNNIASLMKLAKR